MNSTLISTPIPAPPVSTDEVRKGLLRASRDASLAVALLGLFGMLGQWLKISLFASFLPGLIPMRMETGAGLLAAGVGLRLLLMHPRVSWARWLAWFPAALVVTLGGTVLLQHAGLIAWDAGGYDHFLFNYLPGSGEVGALTVKTAGTLLCSGLALLLIDYEAESRRCPAQWLALAVLLSGFWTLLGILFSAGATGEVDAYNRSSVNTALAFMVYGFGVLLARPGTGVMAIFCSNTAAGQMARKILPYGLLMLFVIATATTLGYRLGLYGQPMRDALFTLGSMVILTRLVWRNAHEIDETEREREEAEKIARHQREWFQVMLSSIADAVIATDVHGNVQFLNEVAREVTQWDDAEVSGRPAAEVFRLINTRTGEPMECPTTRVLKHGEITGHPEFATLVTREGDQIAVEDKAAPIRNSGGELIGCVVVFRDVTDRRRAEEMRREVARHYATVAEAIPQMVWTAQADGALDFFNRRWRTYTGRGIEESSGWQWLEAFHEEDRRRCEAAWRKAVATEGRYEVEGRIVQHDGSSRWHLIRALPVIDQQNRISKWFGTCTDIDDQKRAEEAMRFLADASTVLSASQAEIGTLQSVAELAVPKIADLCTVHLSLDAADGPQLFLAAVSHMDPKKVELMVEIDKCFPPKKGQTKGVNEVLRNGMPELAPEVDDWLLDAQAVDSTHRQLLGELGVRSSMMVPLRGHRDMLGVISFLSIESGRRFTARDLSMAEEVARRTTLALENNRLLAEITETKVEAEAANAAKDQFLAVLSHELRTPLTPVLLAVDDLSRDKTLAPHLRNVMEMTRRNIELEARLIDDLLDLTRIQRGKLQLHRTTIDAHALLQSSLEICNGDIASKKLCISLELSAEHYHVHADPARLQQVFWNLIKNSVKFTPTGGSIIFRSRNSVQGSVEVEVEDSGIGIEPDLLHKVFNAFEQGESMRGRRFGGLGLGLAITKNLVEAHGGTIGVQSRGRDLGTTFLVTLTTVTPPATASDDVTNDAEEADATSGLRILLAEDNHDTGTLMRRILERRGYQVDLVTGVEEALTHAKRQVYDLLISDIGLPDGSGLELIERIRHIRPVPGIAMSGFGMDDDIRRSREAGFTEHLTKPVSISKLDEVIKRIASTPAE
ncbi:MAG TPA: PAS domain S-box protein [Chthoniobacteraceae bacterium]|nr:PAS domain S-box protein [Chthoniobacteraceae bacterium]